MAVWTLRPTYPPELDVIHFRHGLWLPHLLFLQARAGRYPALQSSGSSSRWPGRFLHVAFPQAGSIATSKRSSKSRRAALLHTGAGWVADFAVPGVSSVTEYQHGSLLLQTPSQSDRQEV